MKKVFITWLLLFSIICSFAVVYSKCSHAAFGGARGGGSVSVSRGGGSFSGGRSSSFGGSRGSMGGTVSISRPAAAAPSTTTHVIHSVSDGHMGGSGFMNGMLMGTILSQPHTTYVGGSSVQSPIVESVPGGPVVVSESHGLVYWLGVLVIALFAIYLLGIGFLAIRSINEDL